MFLLLVQKLVIFAVSELTSKYLSWACGAALELSNLEWRRHSTSIWVRGTKGRSLGTTQLQKLPQLLWLV